MESKLQFSSTHYSDPSSTKVPQAQSSNTMKLKGRLDNLMQVISLHGQAQCVSVCEQMVARPSHKKHIEQKSVSSSSVVTSNKPHVSFLLLFMEVALEGGGKEGSCTRMKAG